MLINNSQLRRLREAFPRGSAVYIGAAPDAERKVQNIHCHWTKGMDLLQNRNNIVDRINIIEQLVMADGSVKYDIQILLSPESGGYNLIPEWCEADKKMKEILDAPRPKIKMEVIKETRTTTTSATPKPNSAQEGSGFFGALSGAILTAVGVAALKKRSQKNKEKETLTEKIEVDEEQSV